MRRVGQQEQVQLHELVPLALEESSSPWRASRRWPTRGMLDADRGFRRGSRAHPHVPVERAVGLIEVQPGIGGRVGALVDRQGVAHPLEDPSITDRSSSSSGVPSTVCAARWARRRRGCGGEGARRDRRPARGGASSGPSGRPIVAVAQTSSSSFTTRAWIVTSSRECEATLVRTATSWQRRPACEAHREGAVIEPGPADRGHHRARHPRVHGHPGNQAAAEAELAGEPVLVDLVLPRVVRGRGAHPVFRKIRRPPPARRG